MESVVKNKISKLLESYILYEYCYDDIEKLLKLHKDNIYKDGELLSIEEIETLESDIDMIIEGLTDFLESYKELENTILDNFEEDRPHLLGK